MRKRSKIKEIDHKIFNFLKKRKNRFWDIFFLVITHSMAPVTVIFLLTLLGIYVIISKHFVAESFILVLSVLPVAIGSKIKKIFSKPRPEKNIQKVRISERSYSMPSTHAGVAVSLYGFLAFISIVKLGSICLFLFCITMIILICYSRLYLLVHYFSDVLGGIVLGVIVLFPLIFIYEKYYDLLDSRKLIWILLIISWIFIINYYRKCKDEIPSFLRNPPQSVKRIYTGLIVFVITFIPAWIGGTAFEILLSLVFVAGFYEIINIKNHSLKKFLIKIIGIIILLIFVVTAIELRHNDNGKIYTLFYILTAVICDISAYLVGKKYGARKIFSIVSPNKSLEGTMAALFFTSMIIGTLFLNRFKFSYVLSLIITISAIIGDLLESWFKRKLRIKDFSNFLPGHGGILDRVDSGLFAGFVMYLLVKLKFIVLP